MRVILTRLVLLGVVGACVLCLWAQRRIHAQAHHRVYTDPAAVPESRVGLVLGCAPTLVNGRPNLYFTRRIHATVALYHAGKLDGVIVSGDNSRVEYDESSAMKEALIAEGIPPDRIVCDFAGLRTLDSVIRSRKIFQAQRITVISQPFHAMRALYIADHHELDAIAFAAQDVTRSAGMRTRAREWLARVKCLLDVHVLHTGPKYLGPVVERPFITHHLETSTKGTS